MAEGKPIAAHAQQPKDAKPKRKRRWIRIVIVVAAALLLLVFAIPSIISMGIGRGTILGIANGQIPGKLHYDKLSFGWFSGFHVGGVELKDPQGQTVLTLDKVDAPGASLLRLASGSLTLGTVTVDGLTITAEQHEDGTINLLQAVTRPSTATESSTGTPSDGTSAGTPLWPKGLAVELHVTRVNVSLTAPRISAVTVDVPSTKVSLLDPAKIELSTQATISQGQDKGQATVSAAISDLFDSAGVLQQDAAKVKADIDVKDAPVEALDRLAKQNGLLTALLGPKAQLAIHADGGLKGGSATIDASSATLAVKLAVRANEAAVAVEPNGVVKLTLTPQAMAKLAVASPNQPQPTLLKNVDFAVDFKRLSVPRNGDKLDLANTVMDVALNMSPLEMDSHDPAIGRVGLRDYQAAIQSEGLSRKIAVTLKAIAQQEQTQGTIDYAITVNHPLTADLKPDWQKMEIVIDKASVSQLTLALADQLAGTGGVIVAALGPTLDTHLSGKLSFNGSPTSARGSLAFVARAENLDAGLTVNLDDMQVAIGKGGHVDMNLTPDLLAAALKRFSPQQAGKLALRKTVKLGIGLDDFTVPRDGQNLLLGDSSVAMTTTLSDVEIDAGAPVGLVAMRDTAMSVLAPKLGQNVRIKVSSVAEQGGQKGSLAATVDASNALSSAGKFQREKLTASVNVNLKDWPVAMIDQLARQNGALTALIGPQLQVAVNATVTPDLTKPSPATVTVKADRLDAAIHAMVTPEYLTSGPDSRIILTLTPQTLPMVVKALGQKTEGLNLAKNATLTVSLDKLDTPLSAAAMTTARFAATVKLDQLAIAGDPKLGDAEIRNLVITVPETTPAGKVQVTGTGQFIRGNDKGDLKLDLSVNKPMDPSRTLQGDFIVTRIPVALFDAFAGQGEFLVKLLGGVIDQVKLSASMNEKQAITFNTSVQASTLNVALGGDATLNDNLSLRKDGTVEYKLTPEAFAVLMTPKAVDGKPSAAAPQAALVEPVNVKVTVHQLAVPLPPQARPNEAAPAMNLQNAIVETKVVLGSLKIKTAQAETPVQLDDFTITVAAPKLGGQVKFAVTGRIPNPAGGADAGNINITGYCENLLSPDGQVNLKNLTLVLDNGQIVNLPTPLVAAFSPQNAELLDALLGKASTIHLGAKITRMAGPATFQLDAENCHVKVPVNVADGFVTLTGNATADVKVTEKLGKNLMKNVNPLLVQAVGSEKPVTVVVYPEDFRIPLEGFDIAKVSVGRAVIDPGKVTLNNGGVMAAIMRILNAVTKVGGDSKQTQAWFTPVQASVKDGIATYSRMDMLIGENLHMATWGTINLKTSFADMRLGFAERALTQMFKVKNVPADYVVSFPMKGNSTGESMLNIGEITTKIGTLVAQSAVGSANKDVAAILTAVRSVTDKTLFKNEPAPAMIFPLPWPALPAPQQQTEPAQQLQEQPQQQTQKKEENIDVGEAVKGVLDLFGKKKSK
ncbi:MAG: hypothetical protein IT440_00925 [Phycisphaeraceae bacterium]|nr:hypothetical protein [Phycisphaeraceae bacterium]